MSRVWLFSRLSLVVLTCGSVLLTGSQAQAQLGRRLFGRGANRPAAAPAPTRSSVDPYSTGSRGEASDPEFEGGFDNDDGPSSSNPLPAPRSTDSRPGLFGRLLGRGRDSQPSEIPSSPRSTSSKSKKKDSELLSSRDLTPIKQRPVEAYGGKTPNLSQSGLSAPKSTTEGIKRREPVSLAPADSTPSGPIVPPAPDEASEFFDRSAADSGDSLDLPEEPAPLGKSRRATAREATTREPVTAPATTATVTRRIETPLRGTTPKAPQSAFSENEGEAMEVDTDMELDDEGSEVGDTTRDDSVDADPETELESAFDSPYSGRKLDTRTLERRELPSQSKSPSPSTGARRSIDAPATKAARSVSSARTSRTGLMGYCPVVLRDERELVPAAAEFSSMFAGTEYQFSSAEAKRTFDANPRLYVPALGGQDVVHLAEGERGIPGSLTHATWYRGRLYLFASNDTLQQFVVEPSRFATNP
jgi:YHS domain-containing protein